jgi:malonyl-CoA O-methyltransferase
MHDWGDMLVQAGFAEPVMDMERITLTYASPDSLLTDLRAMGRNLHVHRFAGLRGKRWRAQLDAALLTLAQAQPGGRLSLGFEIVYGHALKPKPRMKMAAQTQIDLAQMRHMLRSGGGIAGKV